MNRYEPSTPRAALASIAIALAAITMGALVALPAQLEATNASAQTNFDIQVRVIEMHALTREAS
jgi:ABC-type phosphate/phosphonate transport system permease subunit